MLRAPRCKVSLGCCGESVSLSQSIRYNRDMLRGIYDWSSCPAVCVRVFVCSYTCYRVRKWNLIILSGPHNFNSLFKGSGLVVRLGLGAGLRTRQRASVLKPNIVVQMCDVDPFSPPNSRTTVGVLVPHPDGAVLHMSIPSFWKAPGSKQETHPVTQSDRQMWNSQQDKSDPEKNDRGFVVWPDLLWTKSELCFDLLQRCTSQWMQRSERRSFILNDRNRLLDGKSARWIYLPFNTTENHFSFFAPFLAACFPSIFCNIFCSDESVQTRRTHHWSCLILGYLGSVDTDASSHLCAWLLHWSEREENLCQFCKFGSWQSFIIFNSSNPWQIKSCLI